MRDPHRFYWAVFLVLSCFPFAVRMMWHCDSLLFYMCSAELPLDDLVKMYEGAFAENFHWPQPKPDNDEDTSEEGTVTVCFIFF